MTIKLSLLYTIGFGRDNGLNLALRKVLQYMIGVIALVRQNGIGFESFYQGLACVTSLTCPPPSGQRSGLPSASTAV